MKQALTHDIIILGGGIVGLWTLNRLRQQGYSAILLENCSLGGWQSMNSQGIIHSGIKYQFNNAQSASSTALRELPKVWQNCLAGKGELDLSDVNVLSNHYYLWTQAGFLGRIKQFFANRLLHSKSQRLAKQDYPEVLQQARFRGNLLQVDETVLDLPSLTQTLVKNQVEHCYKIHNENGCQVISEDGKTICALRVTNDQNQSATLRAQHYLFCAGEGNQALLKELIEPPQMQIRPLHMCYVKLEKSWPLYVHYVDKYDVPRITITTHQRSDGKSVWYLGGKLAEDGINKTAQQQCDCARQELQQLFPWLNWKESEFDSFMVNRAEAKQADGSRPAQYYLDEKNNYSVAWPTKLTLVPQLVNELLDNLKLEKKSTETAEELENWQQAKITQAVWEK